ncbi:ejaculatory bulb-specific protein 3-like [Vespula squamosa]|uniref:Ejaculatory bulb-specific protein 3-like n=1 Tax=Vespula squamosa TaxID=30214 RepID=A0ABD2B8J0_VESSQ
MKARIVIALSLIVVVVSYKGQDDMNRLTDKSFVKKQLDCILDRKPCDKIGLSIKDVIPIIAYNNCQRCNPPLKQRYAKLRNFMLRHYPNEWNAIIQYYSKRVPIQG